jgi:hypothetical protein
MSFADRSGWMAIDGVEIVNSARMMAYAQGVGCTTMPGGMCVPCPELYSLVSNPPYIDPVSDDAPWYDPARPESRFFWGVGGIDFLGLAGSPDTVDNGRIVRDIVARVVLAGHDEAALSYGLSWLAAALRGSFCASGICTGSTICVAMHCPTGYAPDPVRTLFDVAVVDRPEVTAVYRMPGYTLWEVEFTLRAANPNLFQDPLGGGGVTVYPAGGIGRIIDLPAVYDRCDPPAPCGEDPECPRPAVPVIPQPPLDPCYPAAPYPGKRVVVQVNALNVAQWLDMVPVVTVSAGDQALRNLTVRFYVNALGMSCDDVLLLDPCSACADITVSYLPPNSVTEIDGRVRRALTRCLSATGEDVDVPALYGPAGQMFTWPEFSCGYGLCIEVLVHEDVSPDATVEIGLFTRQEAA